jgi:hypothetical protein
MIPKDHAMSESKDTPQAPASDTAAAQTTPTPACPAVTAGKSEPAHSRSHRLALLTATVALAAAFGGVIGSFGLIAAARWFPDLAQAVTTAETQTLTIRIAQLSAEVGALKTSVEASSKGANGQLGRTSERIERPQGLPATSAPAAETTGSAPTPAPAPPAESKQAAKPSIVAGWIIRDVYHGVALLENRYGMYEVETGSNVPGVGRVESIKRQDGRWVVVTPKGLITSYR